MTDYINERDKALKKVIDKLVAKIDWSEIISFGSVKLQIREGKATLTTIEQTIKMD